MKKPSLLPPIGSLFTLCLGLAGCSSQPTYMWTQIAYYSRQSVRRKVATIQCRQCTLTKRREATGKHVYGHSPSMPIPLGSNKKKSKGRRTKSLKWSEQKPVTKIRIAIPELHYRLHLTPRRTGWFPRPVMEMWSFRRHYHHRRCRHRLSDSTRERSALKRTIGPHPLPSIHSVSPDGSCNTHSSIHGPSVRPYGVCYKSNDLYRIKAFSPPWRSSPVPSSQVQHAARYPHVEPLFSPHKRPSVGMQTIGILAWCK